MKSLLAYLGVLSIVYIIVESKTAETDTKAWQTCSSCDAHNPKNIKQLILDIELFRDRIDFQFETMVSSLSKKISNIENNIDVSGKQNVDKVRGSIMELGVKINSNIKLLLDNYKNNIKKNNNAVEIQNISQMLAKLGKLSKEFTSKAVGSLETLEISLAKDYNNDISTDKR